MGKWLERLRHDGFSIGWTTLLVGYRGLGTQGQLVAGEEIVAFARDVLDDNTPEERIHDIAELAYYTAASDAYKIESVLTELSKAEAGDVHRETGKWYGMFLIEEMAHLPEEPFDGVMALCEFWATMGWPEERPLEMNKAVHEHTGPYDRPLHLRLVTIHETWLKDLKCGQSAMPENSSD